VIWFVIVVFVVPSLLWLCSMEVFRCWILYCSVGGAGLGWPTKCPMDPVGLGEIGLELLMTATREFGDVRINELKSRKSDRGEVERALFLERWLAEFRGLIIEGMSIPEPRYGEREFGEGIRGEGLASSKSVLLADK